MYSWNQFILCLLLAVPTLGQTNSSPLAATPILQGADLPTYPPIARAAHIVGKVLLQGTVKNGVVVKTEVLSKADASKGEGYLESPSVENLKSWRFAPDVTGTFAVTYMYEISGTEAEDPTNASIEMLPSLDVKITARPVKLTCMDCGAPSMKILPRQPDSSGGGHEAGHVRASVH